MRTVLSNFAPGSVASLLHSSQARSKSSPCGNLRPAAHIVEGSLVGRDHSGAASALDGHIAHRHAALHRKLPDALAGVLDGVACGSGDANLADDRKDDVLCGYAEGQGAFNAYLHGLGLELAEGLGREDVFDL